MAPPFSPAEYADRVQRTRQSMEKHGLDALVIGDPNNINWLTGYDAWSFYTPQIMVLGLDIDPTWIGREMDAGAAAFTTYLRDDQLVPYPEHLVQRPDDHPASYMADWMRGASLDGKHVGYESDVYYLPPKTVGHLQAGLPNATWVDADLLVNWVRVVKSPAEIECLRKAAVLAGLCMDVAYAGIKPGVRQCDLMADIIAAGIKGTPEFGGDMPALHPLVLAGEGGSTAHPMWTDALFETGQTVSFELGGCKHRYNAGLARSVHIGEQPTDLVSTSAAVREGMQAVLDTMTSGIQAGDVHAAWQAVLNRHGLEKKSRIGYSIGVAYGPDWGEHTLSFRANEATIVPENAVVHIILGMWMDGWGMELSETIHIRENDAVCLTQYPWDIHVVDG